MLDMIVLADLFICSYYTKLWLYVKFD